MKETPDKSRAFQLVKEVLFNVNTYLLITPEIAALRSQ